MCVCVCVCVERERERERESECVCGSIYPLTLMHKNNHDCVIYIHTHIHSLTHVNKYTVIVFLN